MTAKMGTAVLAVARPGAVLAGRLVEALAGARAYVPARFAGAPQPKVVAYQRQVAGVVAELFPTHRALVMIMAAGAAVRLIAPHLRGKTVDPAVVVVDDAGRYAIALLSGHAGGANELARRVAAILGAEPIITTASEAHGLPAPDLIGHAFGWRVENTGELKRLAAALINGEPVGLVQVAGEPDWHTEPLPATITCYPSLERLVEVGPPGAIIISDRVLPAAVIRPGWVVYRPRTLVLGIGCSRGATEAEIAALVGGTLAAHGLSPLSVREVATLDRKADEPGLRTFLTARGLPLRLYTAAQLGGVPGQKHPSPIVQAAVGTRGVCEPAALLCAGADRLLVPKQKHRTVTVAVARRSCASKVEEGK